MSAELRTRDRRAPGRSATDSARAPKGEVRDAVEPAIALLDTGEARVAEKRDGELDGQPMAEEGRAPLLPPQSDGGDRRRPRRRALVGQGAVQVRRLGREGVRRRGLPRRARARSSAAAPIIAPGAVLMPSFVNIGAYVGEGTMVDTWATVGSCAQIGAQRPHFRRHRHRRRARAAPGRAGDHRGRLLHRRPLRGRRRRDRRAGRGDLDGRLPRRLDQDRRPRHRRGALRPGARLIRSSFPGTLPGEGRRPGLACAVIVKRVDERTRSKTGINELLRD